jgi:hypothetical protein
MECFGIPLAVKGKLAAGDTARRMQLLLLCGFLFGGSFRTALFPTSHQPHLLQLSIGPLLFTAPPGWQGKTHAAPRNTLFIVLPINY